MSCCFINIHKMEQYQYRYPVARREVFVSVSAFKPKVKNVSPRAWTEPIAVLLLLLLSSSSSLLLLLLLFMGTSNVQTVGIFRMPL
jgi:hypothetical protein